MSPVTRRGALSLVTAAAASVAAPVAVSAATCPNPVLASLWERWQRQKAECVLLEAASNAITQPAMDEVCRNGQSLDDPAIYAALFALCGPSEDAAGTAWEKLNALETSIVELPAATVADLAIKAKFARAVACTNHDTSGPERDWNWDVLILERLFRDVERVSGEAQS